MNSPCFVLFARSRVMWSSTLERDAKRARTHECDLLHCGRPSKRGGEIRCNGGTLGSVFHSTELWSRCISHRGKRWTGAGRRCGAAQNRAPERSLRRRRPDRRYLCVPLGAQPSAPPTGGGAACPENPWTCRGTVLVPAEGPVRNSANKNSIRGGLPWAVELGSGAR